MTPLAGHPDQLSGVRLVELADGPGRGVRLLEFRTSAGLAFEVVVDRAFDIGMASIRGRGLSFTSPVGIRSPFLHQPTGMENWMRGFGGGLLATGGLDHTMGPARDDAARFAYPGMDGEVFPLHGRLTGEPARLRGYGRTDGTLWAEGVVRQAALYGEHLEMVRRVECDDDGTEIRLTDTITNLGAAPNPQMSLYHANLGHPLIGPGARIHVEAEAVRACGDFALDGWRDIPEPRPGFREEVVEIRPVVRDGTARAAVVNAQADLLLLETWDAATLPYLFAWRQFAPGTYVLGLEPSSIPGTDRHGARKADLLRVLEPAEAITHRVAFRAVEGTDAVARALEDRP
ncbi:DUF4432 family protein [Jannaschia sp. LMIT008]|uniref:DUF4432 family protein n=1 Tax=Jannaschia maritima TaxID=3032585 RepID=UPI0028117E89|nr:DUF4432 family protein [Jannaschia sp. LMIT008]